MSTPEEWFRTHILLPGYDAGKHWTDDHDKVIKKCTENPTTIRLFGVLRGNRLVLTEDLPDLQPNAMAESPEQLDKTEIIAYFLRTDSSTASWAKGPYGVVGSDPINSLLRIVQGVCDPNAFRSHIGLPAGVERDLEAAYHGFMARLVEASSQLHDIVIFYLPSELARLAGDDCSVTPDKDIIQQMESIVTHWTKQTREILNKHDITTLHFETLGLMEEINFWYNRMLDLGRINEQLQRRDVNCIITTLTKKESIHMEAFLLVARSVQEGYLETNSNFQLLQNLRGPSQKLSVTSPSKIPSLLPEILQLVRVIVNLSQFYNTEECIASLLRKIGILIIERCRASISLDQIFNGQIDYSKKILREICACLMSWKEAYHHEASLIKNQDLTMNEAARCWDFDKASIFAQADSFIQRCGHLLEFCEGQEQFMRKDSATGCAPGPLPKLGSTKGPGAIKALLEIQSSFQSQLDNVRGLKYDILDVKIHTWQHDYNLLKECLKNLEILYINVMNVVFNGVTEVSEAVTLLNVFCGLACHQSIKQTCIKKTAEVYELFIHHVSVLRQQFDENRRNPPLRFGEPQFAGSVLWAESLAAMATELWEIVNHSKDFVQKTASRNNESELALIVNAVQQARAAYQSFIDITMSFGGARHSLWIEHLSFLNLGSSSWLSNQLNMPLLRWSSSTSKKKTDLPYIARNFNEELLIVFAEVSHWERCKGTFTIPVVAHDICNEHASLLRIQREHVLLTVFEYNSLVDDTSSLSEKRLLRCYMNLLDNEIKKGMSKFMLTTPMGVIEKYARSCCAYCKEVHSLVHTMHAYEMEISQRCHSLSRFPNIEVERSYLQDDKAFVAHQKEYCASVKNTIMRHHSIIVDNMRGIFDIVHNGSGSSSGDVVVNQEWHGFVSIIDHNLEESLSSAVRKALYELGNAMIGDTMSEPPRVIFGMDVMLSQLRGDVECCPTMNDLSHAVNFIANKIIATVKVVPYIRESFTHIGSIYDTRANEQQSPVESGRGINAAISNGDSVVSSNTRQSNTLYSLICKDETVLKNAARIVDGLKDTMMKITMWLKIWDKYKYTWKDDKESFATETNNCKLAEFRTEALKYKDLQENVENEAGVHTINSIKIDCTTLKADIASHCIQWQEKLMGLLNSNCSHQLQSIERYFCDVTCSLKVQPENVADLNSSWSVLKRARKELPMLQDQIKVIEDSYELLKEFDFTVSEEDQSLVSGLHQAGDQMCVLLDETEVILSEKSVSMRRAGEALFRKFVESALEECRWVREHLPYSGNHTGFAANTIMAECKNRLSALQQNHTCMQREVMALDIVIPDILEMKETEQDIRVLEKIWDIAAGWDASWESWKATSLNNLDVENMEASGIQFNKVVAELRNNELHRRWAAWETLSDKVYHLQHVLLPVIKDLKNPAMRLRHWESLQKELCTCVFDPTSPEFSMDSILSLNLHVAHSAAFIRELSQNYNEELRIETLIADIESRWENFDLNSTDKHSNMSALAERSRALNDDAAQLNNIKRMRPAIHFQEDLTHCEETLNTSRQVMDSLIAATNANCIATDYTSARAEANVLR